MWNLRLQPELGVGSTSGDLKSELGCRLAEWLCSGGLGPDLQHSRWLQPIEKHASLDLRLHYIVIHPIAQVEMRRER